MIIKRGNIHLANLDPSIGSEMARIRPVLVVSNDLNNQFNATVTILPITSNVRKLYPFEVLLNKGEGGLPKRSKVRTDQIRTIDKSRLIQRLGSLKREKMEAIAEGLKIHLAI